MDKTRVRVRQQYRGHPMPTLGRRHYFLRLDLTWALDKHCGCDPWVHWTEPNQSSKEREHWTHIHQVDVNTSPNKQSLSAGCVNRKLFASVANIKEVNAALKNYKS